MKRTFFKNKKGVVRDRNVRAVLQRNIIINNSDGNDGTEEETIKIVDDPKINSKGVVSFSNFQITKVMTSYN